MSATTIEAEVLEASSAKTASSTGTTAIGGRGEFRAAEFELDVTVSDTDAGDTLDVFIQTTIDGTNWLDVVHFTQVIGTDTAKRFVAKIVGTLAEAMYEVASALAAGSVRHILGKRYRARWDLVDAGADNASFTFSITANFIP